ncbi:TPA: hypothetical protein OGP67_005059 [Escherichia coli]|nr:hypothetical protein [Escherichia coli]
MATVLYARPVPRLHALRAYSDRLRTARPSDGQPPRPEPECQQFCAWRPSSMPGFASISPAAAATGHNFLLAYCAYMKKPRF